MSEELVIAGKLGIAAICGVATVALALHPATYSISTQRFNLLAIISLVCTRLGLFFGLFVVLGLSAQRSDLDYYVQEGRQILDGLTLYREVQSSYAPLFPFIIAGALSIWNSAKMVVLLTILIEVIAIPFWLAAGRRWFEERTVRQAAVTYCTSAIPLINVAMNGQNQVWQASLLGIALWLLARRDVASGLAYGMTLATVKLLGVLFAPVLWLFARKRTLWLISFALPAVIVYAWCFLGLGLTIGDITFPYQRQVHHITSGNLPYLSSLFGVNMKDDPNPVLMNVYSAIFALGLVAVFLIACARGAARSPANVIHLITLVLLATLLLSKKSYPSYFVLCFFAVCLSLAANPLRLAGLIWLGVFSAAAVIEPSLLFRWIKPFGDLGLLWQETLPEGTSRMRALVFLIIDGVMLGTYFVWFLRTWRIMERGPRSPADG